jgi:hypothetical protein
MVLSDASPRGLPPSYMIYGYLLFFSITAIKFDFAKVEQTLQVDESPWSASMYKKRVLSFYP